MMGRAWRLGLLALILLAVVSHMGEASQLFPEAVSEGETVVLDEARFAKRINRHL